MQSSSYSLGLKPLVYARSQLLWWRCAKSSADFVELLILIYLKVLRFTTKLCKIHDKYSRVIRGYRPPRKRICCEVLTESWTIAVVAQYLGAHKFTPTEKEHLTKVASSTLPFRLARYRVSKARYSRLASQSGKFISLYSRTIYLHSTLYLKFLLKQQAYGMTLDRYFRVHWAKSAITQMNTLKLDDFGYLWKFFELQVDTL